MLPRSTTSAAAISTGTSSTYWTREKTASPTSATTASSARRDCVSSATIAAYTAVSTSGNAIGSATTSGPRTTLGEASTSSAIPSEKRDVNPTRRLIRYAGTA